MKRHETQNWCKLVQFCRWSWVWICPDGICVCLWVTHDPEGIFLAVRAQLAIPVCASPMLSPKRCRFWELTLGRAFFSLTFYREKEIEESHCCHWENRLSQKNVLQTLSPYGSCFISLRELFVKSWACFFLVVFWYCPDIFQCFQICIFW